MDPEGMSVDVAKRDNRLVIALQMIEDVAAHFPEPGWRIGIPLQRQIEAVQRLVWSSDTQKPLGAVACDIYVIRIEVDRPFVMFSGKIPVAPSKRNHTHGVMGPSVRLVESHGHIRGGSCLI